MIQAPLLGGALPSVPFWFRARDTRERGNSRCKRAVLSMSKVTVSTPMDTLAVLLSENLDRLLLVST